MKTPIMHTTDPLPTAHPASAALCDHLLHASPRPSDQRGALATAFGSDRRGRVWTVWTRPVAEALAPPQSWRKEWRMRS
jgi:hypothetical protein